MPEEKSYAWTIAQVKSIMKDETYIGHTIHYRETNISFKNKRRVRKPQSEWVRVENTQEPIISEQVFRQVQEQIANRRRKCKDGTTQIFFRIGKMCGLRLVAVPWGRTGRTASLTAIIIVASTGRAHANAPCTISVMMCFMPMSSPVCNTGRGWYSMMKNGS